MAGQRRHRGARIPAGATIVGLGLLVCLSKLEISLDTELTELANAVPALDQSYDFVTIQREISSNKDGTCIIDSYGSQTIVGSDPSCATIRIVVP